MASVCKNYLRILETKIIIGNNQAMAFGRSTVVLRDDPFPHTKDTVTVLSSSTNSIHFESNLKSKLNNVQ